MINRQQLLIITTTILLTCSGMVQALSQDDPLEPVNRQIFLFNKVVDALFLKPAAVTYDTVLPYPAKASVSNFFDNLANFLTIINDALQFRGGDFVRDSARLVVNTTLGLGGLFDVATPMGLKPHRADLGQTFYAWGWKDSSYFIIPLIGPSTLRDSLGLFGELWMWPPSYAEPKWRNRSYFLAWLNRRYVFRDLESVIGVAGVESYELVRNGYFQSREFKLTGGNVATESHQGVDMLGEPPE